MRFKNKNIRRKYKIIFIQKLNFSFQIIVFSLRYVYEGKYDLQDVANTSPSNCCRTIKPATKQA